MDFEYVGPENLEGEVEEAFRYFPGELSSEPTIKVCPDYISSQPEDIYREMGFDGLDDYLKHLDSLLDRLDEPHSENSTVGDSRTWNYLKRIADADEVRRELLESELSVANKYDIIELEGPTRGGFCLVNGDVCLNPRIAVEADLFDRRNELNKSIVHELSHKKISSKSAEEIKNLYEEAKRSHQEYRKFENWLDRCDFDDKRVLHLLSEGKSPDSISEEFELPEEDVQKRQKMTLASAERSEKMNEYYRAIRRRSELKIKAINEGFANAAAREGIESLNYSNPLLSTADLQLAYNIFEELLERRPYGEVADIATESMDTAHEEDRNALKVLDEII